MHLRTVPQGLFLYHADDVYHGILHLLLFAVWGQESVWSYKARVLVEVLLRAFLFNLLDG